MTAQSHTRRTVITSGAAVAGAAVGTVALAACGGGDSSSPADQGGSGESGPPAQPGQRIAAVNDVPVGGSTVITTPSGQEAVLARESDTKVSAFSAICTHQGCAVTAEGAELRCPCHGSMFDAFTGAVKQGPATEPLPSIAVTVENGEIVTA
ncbi:ferredoxin [Prauserella marina]|uniref:Rieske (2Fe-2S) protein n=1 Tax=Prauserella marina TaxID=530584 RepID=UPI000B871656|nr:Rieske (2Fe-2S) protein [Prauserella marina]ASR36912.1 ferredoxin [Prauserella marina]